MLVLFDIDGTLLADNIYAPQALAIRSAVQQLFGAPLELGDAVDWAGKTDLQIAREIAVLAGASDAQYTQRRPEVAALIEQEFARRCEPSLTDRVTAGMRDVVAQVAASPGCLASVVTGNLQPLAALKLRRAGLLDTPRHGSGPLQRRLRVGR